MQYDFGVIDPLEINGTELAELLGQFRTAVHTNHAGDTPPAYITENMLWADISGSNIALRFNDGTENVRLGVVNPTTHTFFPDGVDPPVGVVDTATDITATQNSNKLIYRFTAAASLTVDPVANLTDGWSVIIDARGGAATVNPDDSELVNGLTTDIVPAGSFGILYKQGTGFFLLKPATAGGRGAFVNLASAATTNLGSVSSTAINITGNVNITSFGTSVEEGAEILLRFAGTQTITAGTNITTPGGGNITTFPGMYMLLKMDASNVWRILWYSDRLMVTGGGANKLTFDLDDLSTGRVITVGDSDYNFNGISIDQQAEQTVSGTSFNLSTTLPPDIKRLSLKLRGITASATAQLAARLGSSAGFATTGYSSVAGNMNNSTNQAASSTVYALLSGANVGTGPYSGIITFERMAPGSNVWVYSGTLTITASIVCYVAGSVTLPGELDRIQLVTVAGTASLGGACALSWEF